MTPEPQKENSILMLLALIPGIGLLCGGISAVFLFLLKFSTETYLANPNLVWTLPILGCITLGIYTFDINKSIKVLAGTLLTHLGGGSGGREGAAVEMSSSLAEPILKNFPLSPAYRHIGVMMAMGAGFAGVFGVPFAGAFFGFEIQRAWLPRYPELVLSRLELWVGCLSALASSWIAHKIVLASGMTHTLFTIPNFPTFSLLFIGKFITLVTGLAIISVICVSTINSAKIAAKKWLVSPVLRMITLGVLLGLISLIGPMSHYLGLGIPLLESTFAGEVISSWSWVAKLMTTTITVSAGFIGGEVTPLFVIGATAGSTLSRWLDLPSQFGAALGLVGVFAGAARLPLTCSLLALDLFGWPIVGYAIITCYLIVQVSGRDSIYPKTRKQTQ